VTVPFDDKHYMDLQVATFAMGESETAAQSQIDFIMIKAQHVTLSAKQASIIADYPVAAWRGGPRHYPVLAMVPIPKPPWNHKVQVQASPVHIDREQLIGDSRMAYPPPRLENLRAEISANLHLSVDSYNTVLMQAAQKHYPLKKTDMQAPTQSEELANCAKRMWSIFRQMRSHRFTLPGVLTAWKQWTQFQQAHRIHKERSRQRSKQRKIDLLQQAQQAAAQGNVHELWKTIRRLAPKAPRKRLQLHKDGHMISPEAELDWILEAYGDRYAVDDHQAPISFTFPQHQGLALDSKVLHFYLQRLNPRKAVPHGTAPAVVWRVCADLLALPVTQAFNDPPDGKLMILQRWSDADVALLPKAHGRSESPLDWRPIGVQDPLGKCLMSTVVAQARQAIHDLIVQYPQCAYVRPGSPYMINMRGRSDTFFDIDNFEAPSSHDVVYDKIIFAYTQMNFHLQINTTKTQAILKVVGRTTADGPLPRYFTPVDLEYSTSSTSGGEQAGELQKAIMKHTRAIVSNQEDLLRDLQRADRIQARNNLGDSHGLEELDEFFGGLRKPMTGRSLELLPNKRRRPALGQSRDDMPAHPSLVVSLAKQVIRQEEEIKLLKQDHSLIFFLRPGENSMINHLFQTAKSFKAKQAANPQWAPGQQPLKVIMAIAMFKELGARLEALCQDQTRLAQVKEFGWRDPATGWKFQRWNPQLKALEEDNSKSPISDQMVANHLQKLCQALAQDTVHRFHCTRKMADVMESPATFQLDLSTRTAISLEAWAALMALQGCTVLQLGGFAYKRETLKPSPAIAKLKDMIYGR
ncbi:unnamed protein product, partial [Symbiodinium sp. KB8]